MESNEARRQGVLTGEIEEAEAAGEAPSLASVWKCPQCGCQIQIVIAPSGPVRRPFGCVDGTPMVAGQIH